MSANIDFDAWRERWRSHSDALDIRDLRGRIDRETQRMRIAMIYPILVTVIAGGGALLVALRSRVADDIVLALGVWCFILTGWSCGLWLARYTWRPLAETTSSYVQLSIARCRSALSAIRVGEVLYCVGFVGVIVWKSYYHSLNLFAVLTAWATVVFATMITPAVFLTLAFFARRRRNELAALIEIQRQIVEDPTQ
jgi:hypothetical protein